MSDSSHSVGWALAGFALGTIVGAAVMVLAAPYTGEETRSRLKDLAEDALEKGRKKGSELLVKVKEGSDEALEAATEKVAPKRRRKKKA